jgi:XTP/dITP diphosphohydrolase
VPQLLIATTNSDKVRELRTLLAGCGWEIVTPSDVGITLDVEETGETYAENARMKAVAGMEASGLVTLADDSGIEVEAMGGEPGVHSARFLGVEVTYPERFEEIFQRLEGLPRSQRNARFVAVMAIADSRTGDVRFSEGEVRGLIADKARGEGGFGYDPIFWVPQHTGTMAELPQWEKDIISHRARAAAGARQILRELLYEHRGAHPSYTRHR